MHMLLFSGSVHEMYFGIVRIIYLIRLRDLDCCSASCDLLLRELHIGSLELARQNDVDLDTIWCMDIEVLLL
jgi:hypothetical protein